MTNNLVMDNLFVILKELFSGNEIIYVSTPINTGERFIQWYKNFGNAYLCKIQYADEKKKNVIDPNVDQARESIKKIRKSTGKVIIDPTTFESETLNWTQEEFYKFWDKIIKELVDETIFLDGWEYSIGCCHELLSSLESNIIIYSQDMRILSVDICINKVKNAIETYKQFEIKEAAVLERIIEQIKKYNKSSFREILLQNEKCKMKDEKLDILISNKISNIAQFISFEPSSDTPKQKFCHINNFNFQIDNIDTKELILRLIDSAPSKAVNIRSFHPDYMKGNKLIFSKKKEDIDEIINIINENSKEGKFSIVNENIDINDCGVSGVALGNVVEFSPEDTPKCVDKEGVCSLPREIALKILHTVYGFSPDINFDYNFRIEFSIHPERQGVNKQNTIIWEYEYVEKPEYERKISWPNNFSRFLGDKVFGLLIAHSIGLLVPKTTVISRKVAPFVFGASTGMNEKWIRTCPIVKEPGKFHTSCGWIDPFILISKEERKGNSTINIASVLSQEGINPVYSGAAIITSNPDSEVIEGVKGKGDGFMLGEIDKENLPATVIDSIKALNNQIRNYNNELGNVSIEWVYDGTNVWVVQLNQYKTEHSGSTQIVVGNPKKYEKFNVNEGLNSLRDKIKTIKSKNIGIELIGNIGITSHFGDILRAANIPSKITNESNE